MRIEIFDKVQVFGYEQGKPESECRPLKVFEVTKHADHDHIIIKVVLPPSEHNIGKIPTVPEIAIDRILEDLTDGGYTERRKEEGKY